MERRQKSFINELKEKSRLEQARRMTPEQRLEACAHLSEIVKELELEGKRMRAAASRKPKV